ncbi:A-kinase anchor protein 17B [Suricata suricatta]|uniref:A-kinase anchor protein 17B n=1 Tax=Suricata suricatta TaxID=37032 RepID=UPI001155E723|nr:A-kinase anchor protein 17B [Suricata suricatta]
MTVTVVYDNSEATELCAARHLYLKPIAKLMINVLLPETSEPTRPFSNWEVLDQLKSLICPDQFTAVRLSKSTKDFIRFEGEAETRSLVQILKAKLHGKMIKLNGLKTDLKVVATDDQAEWERLPGEKEASLSDGAEGQDQDKSPDSIYFEGLPCKWFAPKGSSGEKPCEEILRVVFESFGKIKNVDIPMLDPYREVTTSGHFGGFSFGLQTFEAFIQYQESTDFVKAMESLRGMKLMLKGDDGKALACNIKVKFDTTKHFSEGAIRRRNQERLKLQELEEERKKEKRRDEKKAARKRKEEERRARAKKRKARVRRRAQKERDQPRQKKPKEQARAEAASEPESLEEWEERKYLLTQRRGEALRLLRVLLRTIAESTPFNPQWADDPSLGSALETLKKEVLNSRYLQNWEEVPKYHVAKSHHKRKRKMKKRSRSYFYKSSQHHKRTTIRYSSRKERAGKALADEHDSSVSDQNSWQNARIQGQPLENEDWYSFHESNFFRLSEQWQGRKQKIYETDEFIDYMFNYYHAPEYVRICLQPSYPVIPEQWQRAVHAKGNGFQVTLRKEKDHSASLSPVQKPATREQARDDDLSEICTQDPEHEPQKRGRVGRAKKCSKELTNHCKDTAREAGDHLSPADGNSHLSEKMHAYQDRDSKSTSQSQPSSPNKSEDLEIQLTDFLEEISSDSECFSEILSTNKEDGEKSVTSYCSSPEKRSRNADEILTSNQIKSSPQTWCSEWNRDREESYSEYKLCKPVKSSKYELTYSWLTAENSFMRGERNNSKQRETLAPRYMFDEGYYRGSSSGDQLDDMTRKKRRFDDSTFGQNVNYRSPPVPIASSNSANVFYFRNFPQRREIPWLPEYNQEGRRFKRNENFKDFTLNSGNYYVRQSSQQHMDCGSYLQARYASPLSLQMF